MVHFPVASQIKQSGLHLIVETLYDKTFYVGSVHFPLRRTNPLEQADEPEPLTQTLRPLFVKLVAQD